MGSLNIQELEQLVERRPDMLGRISLVGSGGDAIGAALKNELSKEAGQESLDGEVFLFLIVEIDVGYSGVDTGGPSNVIDGKGAWEGLANTVDEELPIGDATYESSVFPAPATTVLEQKKHDKNGFVRRLRCPWHHSTRGGPPSQSLKTSPSRNHRPVPLWHLAR